MPISVLKTSAVPDTFNDKRTISVKSEIIGK
jgi:hypothetical protein